MCQIEKDMIRLVRKKQDELYGKQKLIYSMEGRKQRQQLREYEDMFYEKAYEKTMGAKDADEAATHNPTPSLLEQAEAEFEGED